jgi:hypothetical protein
MHDGDASGVDKEPRDSLLMHGIVVADADPEVLQDPLYTNCCLPNAALTALCSQTARNSWQLQTR